VTNPNLHSEHRARYGWESNFPVFSETKPAVVRVALEEFLADVSESQVFAWKESIPRLRLRRPRQLVHSDS
jgi:hypothetical protein